MGEWYYIGHYGQLGPLSREQIDDLIRDGVITRDTYVWRSGMSDWIGAARVPDLHDTFQSSTAVAAPPPPPSPRPAAPSPTTATMSSYGADPLASVAPSAYYPTFGGIRSDRSRTAAGILQLFLPGVGRMYLGYMAYGVLQLVLTFATCGFLYIWSFIDGIIILTGGVKLDGYGRQLND